MAATQEKVSILEFVSERYPQEEDPVEKIILVEQLSTYYSVIIICYFL